MPFTQVKDVLKKAIEFRKMLIEFYEKIEDSTEKENVKMLVDYMSMHEKVLEEDMEKISEEQEKQFLEEWVKYEPKYATRECFAQVKIGKDSSVDEVIDAGLMLNQCLINLYHQMAEIAPFNDLKALFSALETMEVAEKKKLARMKGTM